MQIEFSSISTFQDVVNAATVLELITIFNDGYATLDDVPCDVDTLMQELRDDPSQFGLDADEEAEFLAEEVMSARTLASEKLSLMIEEELQDRKETLGPAYPFDISKSAETVVLQVRYNQRIHPAAVCTLWIRFYALLNESDLVQCSDGDISDFRRRFEELFEVISVVAASVRGEGAAWWTGRSRKQQSFLNNLDVLVKFLGSGKVKSSNELLSNQIRVNDGGFDGLVVFTVGGRAGPASECYLIGATVQTKRLRQKIVGESGLTRFREFFDPTPSVGLNCVLAVPHSWSDALQHDCRVSNCLYMPRSELISFLGVVGKRDKVASLRGIEDMLFGHVYELSRETFSSFNVVIGGETKKVPDFHCY